MQQPSGEWNMTSGRFVDPKTRLYCQNPPWGMLTAVNVNTGDIAWQVNLGISDLLPEGKKNTSDIWAKCTSRRSDQVSSAARSVQATAVA